MLKPLSLSEWSKEEEFKINKPERVSVLKFDAASNNLLRKTVTIYENLVDDELSGGHFWGVKHSKTFKTTAEDMKLMKLKQKEGSCGESTKEMIKESTIDEGS